MKTNVTHLLAIVFMISCSEPLPEKGKQGTVPRGDSLPEKTQADSLRISGTEGLPTKDFMDLVTYMDSCEYKTDPGSVSEHTKQFNGIGLNHETYENSFMHALLKDTAVFEEGSMSLTRVSYSPVYDQLFAKAQHIWSYAWRIPDADDGLKRRGMVEEWIFDAEVNAKSAQEFLINEQEKIGFPFCKTAAFYVVCGKSLYMFSSNNSGVAYRNKRFYIWLDNRCRHDRVP